MRTIKQKLIGLLILLSLAWISGCGGGGSDGGAGTGPASARVIGSLDLPGGGHGVVVNGNYAYVGAGGLRVVDVSEPSTPFIAAAIDSIFVGGTVLGFLRFGSVDLVSAPGGLDGVHLVDVTDPLTPAPTTTNTPGNVVAVGWTPTGVHCAADSTGGATDGTGAVVVSSLAGVRTVPTTLPTFAVAHTVSPVPGAATGNYCLVTGLGTFGTGRLFVIDVSSPSSAFVAATLDLAGTPAGIAIAGNYAYVIAGNPGMYVIDVSVPTAPVVVGQTPPLPTTGPIDVDPIRMRAYVGTTDTVGFPNDGLKIIDISNPSAPAVIATVDLPNWTGGVAARDGIVYAATFVPVGETGTPALKIVDVSGL